MDTKYLIAIIVIIILGAGAYFIWGTSASAPATVSTTVTATTSDMGDMGNMDMGSATSSSDTTMGSSTTSTGTGSTSGNQTAGTIVVDYTANGFSPSTITIAQGQTVTFVDQTSNPIWVATNPHPVHTGYDGTSMSEHCAAGYAGAAPFDECASTSGSWSFTFNKVGSWGYHNHLAPNMQGTIVVTAN